MPHSGAFRSTDHYVNMRLHETVLWSGHAARLGRTSGKRLGHQPCSLEELVAEFGLPDGLIDDHASCVGHRSGKRVTSRDLFDLWYIVARLGRSIEKVLQQMASASPHICDEGLLARMIPARLPSTDFGFETDLADALHDVGELLERMTELVRDYHRRAARAVALRALTALDT